MLRGREFPPHVGNELLECISVSMDASAERIRKAEEFLCLVFHKGCIRGLCVCCHVVEHSCHNWLNEFLFSFLCQFKGVPLYFLSTAVSQDWRAGTTAELFKWFFSDHGLPGARNPFGGQPGGCDGWNGRGAHRPYSSGL